MKQTIEEAAKDELLHSYTNKYNGNGAFEYGQEAMLNMFFRGAKGQARQSPWISVDEQLPETNDNVLLLNKLNRSGKYFVQENSYTNGEWAVKSAMFYTPIAWMPIPSFDEILEANEDILERIKEKGD